MNQERLFEDGIARLAIDQVEWLGRMVSFRAPQGMSFLPHSGANYELESRGTKRTITIEDTQLSGAQCFFKGTWA